MQQQFFYPFSLPSHVPNSFVIPFSFFFFFIPKVENLASLKDIIMDEHSLSDHLLLIFLFSDNRYEQDDFISLQQ